jgi:hypothetical protein
LAVGAGEEGRRRCKAGRLPQTLASFASCPISPVIPVRRRPSVAVGAGEEECRRTKSGQLHLLSLCLLPPLLTLASAKRNQPQRRWSPVMAGEGEKVVARRQGPSPACAHPRLSAPPSSGLAAAPCARASTHSDEWQLGSVPRAGESGDAADLPMRRQGQPVRKSGRDPSFSFC